MDSKEHDTLLFEWQPVLWLILVKIVAANNTNESKKSSTDKRKRDVVDFIVAVIIVDVVVDDADLVILRNDMVITILTLSNKV